MGNLIHRGAAYDEDDHFAAERIDQFLADGGIDRRVEQRNLHGDRHRALFQQRQYLLAVDLFQNERHAADHGGLYHLHRLDEDLRRGNLSQQRHVATYGQRGEEIERTAVGVGQRQERQRAAAAYEIVGAGLGVPGVFRHQHVAREVVHRQHDPLGVARRTGGVVQQHHLVVGDVGIFDVVGREPPFVFGAVVFHHVAHVDAERLAAAFVDDVEIGERQHRVDAGDFVLLDDVPVVVADEEQAALGVVDDVYDVGGREVLEDGDDDRSVGDRRQIGDAPARIVAADERDLVAAADLRFFEEEV